MLDLMREHSRSLVIYLMFGIIIIVFVLSFGPGSLRSCGGDTAYAARVNGRVLTDNDYRMEYDRLYRYWSARYGDRFDDTMAERLGLRTQALENIIQSALLTEEARHLGLAVADEEVLDAINDMTWFHDEKTGRFSFDLFQRMVNYHYKTTPGGFKEKVREDLLAERMRAVLASAVRVSKAELRDRFDEENDKADLEYLDFDPNKFRGGIEVTEEEKTAFVKDHKDRVDKYYEDHQRRYVQPAAVRARRILIELKEGLSDAGKRRLERRASKLREEAQGGADFAALARENSTGPKKDQGGDLGFVEAGMMSAAFDEQVLGLKQGEVSEVFEDDFGFNVVKVEAVREAVNKTVDDVANEIATELIMDDRAKALAKEKAEAALAKAKAGTSFGELAGEVEVPEGEEAPEPPADAPKKGTTAPFPRNRDSIPWIGKSEELLRLAFELQPGTLIGTVIESGDKFYVVRVKDRTYPSDEDFEEQQDRLENRVRDEKRRAILTDWLARARENATVVVASSVAVAE